MPLDQEISEAVGGGLERVLSDLVLLPVLPQSSRRNPPQTTTQEVRSLQPSTRPTGTTAGANPHRRSKRPLSSDDTQPHAKKRHQGIPGQLEEDSDQLEPTSEHPQDPTLTAPNVTHKPVSTLLSRVARNVIQEQKTIQQPSTIGPEPNLEPVQPQPEHFDPNASPVNPIAAKHGRRHDTDSLLSLSLTALRTYLGNQSATFMSESQHRLIVSVASKNYTVGVLPTGSGKSMAFELPPIFMGQTTIVAIPYRLIVSQVLEKAKERGLRAVHWNVKTSTSWTLPEDPVLIVVAFETLLNESFIE